MAVGFSSEANYKKIGKKSFRSLCSNLPTFQNLTSWLVYHDSLSQSIPHSSVYPKHIERVLTANRKRDYISLILDSLQWLPFKSRSDIKNFPSNIQFSQWSCSHQIKGIIALHYDDALSISSPLSSFHITPGVRFTLSC